MDESNIVACGRRRRRSYSADFKARVVAECSQPDVSVAAIALKHGVNANLVRRWVSAAERGLGRQTTLPSSRSAPAPGAHRGFVPIQIESAATAEIRVSIQRGASLVNVSWPVAAAQSCAIWLRGLMR